jgi:hexosaminidase
MKVLSIVSACVLITAGADAKTFLYPIPQHVEWYGTSAHIADTFKFRNIHNEQVHKAANRYMNLIRKEKWEPVQVSTDNSTVKVPSGELLGINFQIGDSQVKLDFGIDESYNLIVPSTGFIDIKAKTWVGALRGLETLSQLAVANKNNELVVHAANITDAPTYPHRGISLDTSRNFYPVEDILRTLEAQAYNKMNVFHWHVTDSQSWPLYFKSHPELSENGAYSDSEVYTPEDVEKVIDFAEDRGIRVILELDMPAHTASIGESYPESIICGNEKWNSFA